MEWKPGLPCQSRSSQHQPKVTDAVPALPTGMPTHSHCCHSSPSHWSANPGSELPFHPICWGTSPGSQSCPTGTPAQGFGQHSSPAHRALAWGHGCSSSPTYWDACGRGHCLQKASLSCLLSDNRLSHFLRAALLFVISAQHIQQLTTSSEGCF